MKKIFLILFVLMAVLPSQAADIKLFVDGVRVDTRPVVKDGMPYFPVDALSAATRVRVESFDSGSVKLAGCPVKFVAVVQDGRPYLPAEAFAMATGGQVERDEVRGVVLFKTGDDKDAREDETEQAAPEAPQPAPASPIVSAPQQSTAGLGEATTELLKATAEATYAERYMRHKLWWASQLDPANSPYMQHTLPPVPGAYAAPPAYLRQ